MNNIIQVAGIIDVQEAEMVLEAGVDWIGFPFYLPVHSEDISVENAAAIIARIPEGRKAVVITYLRTADDVIGLCRRLGTNTVQLHGDISLHELEILRQKRPQLVVLKSIVLNDPEAPDIFDSLQQHALLVDAFLTDSYDPKTGAKGATGLTHDWSISRRIVSRSEKPVILAGGLNPENVRQAILQVRPAGVDAHTGLENSNGRKDARLVKTFVEEARAAFQRIETAEAQ